MKKRLAALGLGTALFSTAAIAGAMENIIGNTLVVSGANGTMRVTMAADGTYTSDSGISGTWTAENGELCTTRSTGESNCVPLPEDAAVGSSWDSEDATGAAVTVTVE